MSEYSYLWPPRTRFDSTRLTCSCWRRRGESPRPPQWNINYYYYSYSYYYELLYLFLILLLGVFLFRRSGQHGPFIIIYYYLLFTIYYLGKITFSDAIDLRVEYEKCKQSYAHRGRQIKENKDTFLPSDAQLQIWEARLKP